MYAAFWIDPFDRGAGGGSVTWSSRSHALNENPALLSLNSQTLGWAGTQSVLEATQSMDLKGKLDIPTLEKNPLHLSMGQNTSLILHKWGMNAMALGDMDLKVWSRGDPIHGAGTPTVSFRSQKAFSYSCGGAYALSPWLHVGAVTYYLGQDQKIVLMDLVDKEEILGFQDKVRHIFNDKAYKKLFGYDVGSLVLLSSSWMDVRLASVFRSEKNSAFSLDLGVGLTLHTDKDAIHLSLDYRDLKNIHKRPIWQRVQGGARYMLHQYFGLSAGFYHNEPSLGLVMDLWLIKLSLARYTLSYGENSVLDSRPVYALSLAFEMG